jgi:TRAP-type C4-dicarboxylate transport system permease small subunit
MKFLSVLTVGLRTVAMIALVAMMLVTTLDISMRLAINQLVLGSVEVVQLTIVVVVFCAIPETFLRSQHITVDAIDQLVSPLGKRVLRFVGSLLTLFLLSIMAVRMVPIALDTLVVGDLTTDLQISLFWYWLPILVGTAAAALAMILVTVERFAEIHAPDEQAEAERSAY